MSKFTQWIARYPYAPREHLLDRVNFLGSHEMFTSHKMLLQNVEEEFLIFSSAMKEKTVVSLLQKQKLAELKLHYELLKEQVNRIEIDAEIERRYIQSLLEAH